ncbi:MAG TPA: hypothetical protein VFZ59_20745 [Verrucomicrobiae bacterium]|nr:hypothetical protein [Verrucomicrobiae bacterium]
MGRIRITAVVAIIGLTALFVALSWNNSVVVKSVAIRVKEGVKEHTDHTVLGLGAEHYLPDYRVKLQVTRRLLAVDLGTKLNTSYKLADLSS